MTDYHVFDVADLLKVDFEKQLVDKTPVTIELRFSVQVWDTLPHNVLEEARRKVLMAIINNKTALLKLFLSRIVWDGFSRFFDGCENMEDFLLRGETEESVVEEVMRSIGMGDLLGHDEEDDSSCGIFSFNLEELNECFKIEWYGGEVRSGIKGDANDALYRGDW